MARAVGICDCRCHNTARANQRGANALGEYMTAYTFAQRAKDHDAFGCVEDADVLEAAAACPTCRDKHCAALSSVPKRQPRVIRIVKRFNPNSDSQRNQQADGDKGEGPET